MGTGNFKLRSVLCIPRSFFEMAENNHQALLFQILGHFTQVVWKNSKNLGIAKARSSSGKIIVVANYEPAGNFIGQYVQNVPAPKN